MAFLLINKTIVEFNEMFGNAFRVPVYCSNCFSDFINDNWHYWKFCPECGEPIENAGMARDAEQEVVDEALRVMGLSFTEEYKEIQNEFS